MGGATRCVGVRQQFARAVVTGPGQTLSPGSQPRGRAAPASPPEMQWVG